jgi:DNA helicase IV
VKPNEQAAVAAMYARLDAEIAAAEAELAALPPARSAEQAAMSAAVRRRLRDLRAAEPGLVFGRIDHADGTALHIGRRGLWVDGEPLLIDWRAPAAAPFYAATPAHPMGLRRRRHLRLTGRTVHGVADEILDGSPPGADDILGDGPLAEALSAPRTGRMRDAVSTLQAEQDAIVRAPSRGITVVQGGPGTGKTVVALHRAAYVLFAYPPASRGVMVVGPDARFLDYIAEVLPSLGEHDVRLVTREGLAAAGSPTEPAADRSPPAARADGADPYSVARLAGRAEMARGLAGWVAARRPGAVAVTLPAMADEFALGADVVGEALAAARGLPHNPGREVFRERLVAELVRARSRAMAEQLERIDAETAAATGVDLDAAVGADLRSLGLEGAAAAVPEAEDPRAARGALLADPRLDDAITAMWPRLTAGEVVDGLLAEPTAYLPESFAVLRATAAGPALLDEAAALVHGATADVYGHVVVDEAQELTEMDWRAVLRRCPSRSMTVVGDFAQAGPGSTVRSWPAALGAGVVVHTLTVNYRTTAEILESTRDLLASIAPEQVLSRSLRHGEPPVVRAVPAAEMTAAVLAELAAPDRGLTAVICADEAAGEWSGGAVDSRARVVPVSAARGLEFDTVVVVDPHRISAARPGGRRDLYVALTRATRRLRIVEPRRSGRAAKEDSVEGG